MPSVSHPLEEEAQYVCVVGGTLLLCCHHKATKPWKHSLPLKILAKCGLVPQANNYPREHNTNWFGVGDINQENPKPLRAVLFHHEEAGEMQ